MASGKRLDHIHGLRGIAALMVVVQHSFELSQLGGSGLFDVPLANVNLGRLGVVLFFLISGLVVPFSFKGERPLLFFAISRFFRLYPAYWLSIAVFVAIAFWRGSPVPMAQVGANLTMLQSFFGEANLGHGYWTLLFEVVFYALCMVLYAAGVLRSAPVVGTIAALFLAGSVMQIDGEASGNAVAVLFYFALFFIGMILRLAFVDNDKSARGWAVLLTIAGSLAGIAAGGVFAPVFENGTRFFSPTALAAAMALPIPLFVLVLWLRPVPGKALMFLGTVSYSVYLFQQPVLDLMRHVLPPGEWPIVYLMTVAGIVIAISAAVYRWVEMPMIEFGKKLSRKDPAKPALELASGKAA